MWLSWLGVVPGTKRLLVRLLVRAHAQVGGRCAGGSPSIFCSHISISLFSLPLATYLKRRIKCVPFRCYFITYYCIIFSLFRFGDVSLQESINQENFELLKEYYSIFMEKMPPDCKSENYRNQQ